jgi:hypothetical protein
MSVCEVHRSILWIRLLCKIYLNNLKKFNIFIKIPIFKKILKNKKQTLFYEFYFS